MSRLHPLLLLPSIFPSIRDFSNESAVHIQWPKYWSFSFSISPFKEYSGLISTGLISMLSKGLSGVFSSTTVWSYQSLRVQPFYGPALTITCDHWEDHSLDSMDLCWQSDISDFQHTVSRFVIAFLSRSNCLLILWLQSPSAVISEPKKRKSVTTSTFSLSICHEVMGHFIENRWEKSGNSIRLYFGGLQNHSRWWLQPWN